MTDHSHLIIAIDGPAGAGKSSVAKRLATEIDALYIDSGAMYRAVAYTAIDRGVDLTNGDELTAVAKSVSIELKSPLPAKPGTVRVFADGAEITDNIRTPEISQITSQISAISGVRRHLVAAQRTMAKSSSVVMEGRDIGTVVFPEASLKIFLTASAEERGRRRMIQLEGEGRKADLDFILAEIKERDLRDTTRADSPLIPAQDSVTVLTDGLSEEEVVAKLAALVRGLA